MKKIANGIYRLTLGKPEDVSLVSVLEPTPRLEKLNELTDMPVPFDERMIHLTKRQGGCLLEIPLDPEEELYGLGLTLKSFRQSGLKKQLRTNSDPVADNGDSHAPAPFYVSSKGYGILVDTVRYATFYMGNVKKRGSKQDAEAFASAGTQYGHWWIKQGSGNVFVDIPAAEGVDIYIFSGESMKDAVARYNLFSGGGAYVPLWGLGVMYRGYMHGNEEHMLHLAQTLRDQHIPCDIFGLEPGWQSHFYSCTYQWDNERYPEPEKMVEQMKSLGYHMNLWEHAYVHPDSPAFENLKPFSGDCYVWDGLVPDFTLPEARKAYQEIHQPIVDAGVTGFKLDECDGSDFTANWGFPNFAAFPGGMDGEQMHTVFGMLYQQTMQQMMECGGIRTYGEVRQSTALAAPYPYVLYSDLYDHADFVRGMANAAFSGILWTPEVRQADSKEELLRRIAAAVVSPQTVLNAYMVKMPPWMQYDREKNLNDEYLPENEQKELLNQVRSLLTLRMRLIPQLYAAFAKYHTEGIPPVRPLIMDFPEEIEAKDIWDQFMLGEGLMAAPVIAGTGDSRRIYLPSGVWYDFYTEERLEGGCWIERRVPLDEIPLFVRRGTLLPLAKPVECIRPDLVFELEPVAYGSQCCTCALPDDDGESMAYKTEGIPMIHLEANENHCRLLEQSERYRIASFRRVRS